MATPEERVQALEREHEHLFSQATPEDMEGVYKVAASLFGNTTSAEARKPLIELCPDGKPLGEGRFRFVMDIEQSDIPLIQPYKKALAKWRKQQLAIPHN